MEGIKSHDTIHNLTSKSTAEIAKVEGNQAFANKNYDEAIAHYTTAINLDPDTAVYYSNRSACFAAKFMWKEAEDDAYKCVKKDVTFVKGYCRLATAQTALGRDDESYNTLKLALTIEPDNVFLMKELRLVEQKKNKNLSYSSELRPDECKLSGAEMLRIERIKRNDDFLKSIGLAATSTCKKDADKTKKKKVEKIKKDKNEMNEEEPARKSARKAGLQPEFTENSNYLNDLDGEKSCINIQKIVLKDFKVDINPDDETVKRNKVTAKMLRETIDQTNKRHSEIISDEAITHCVYRITSMSNKALGTRIKMIARAAGQHSYEKLLVFHYALKAAGLNDLAESSRAALDHLEGIENSEETKNANSSEGNTNTIEKISG